MRNDDELYSSFLSGESSAFDELMIRYGDSLTYYLNGYLHNPEDAEDLMIESFARIMVKKPKIHKGNFKAYLYKTARNLASRFHEKKKRTGDFSLDDLNEQGIEPVYSEDNYLEEERKKALHMCIKRLDPWLREALWLFYFEGLSYADAADVMGVSKKKIDHLLSKGKEQLKRELAKEGIVNAYE